MSRYIDWQRKIEDKRAFEIKEGWKNSLAAPNGFLFTPQNFLSDFPHRTDIFLLIPASFVLSCFAFAIDYLLVKQ